MGGVLRADAVKSDSSDTAHLANFSPRDKPPTNNSQRHGHIDLMAVVMDLTEHTGAQFSRCGIIDKAVPQSCLDCRDVPGGDIESKRTS